MGKTRDSCRGNRSWRWSGQLIYNARIVGGTVKIRWNKDLIIPDFHKWYLYETQLLPISPQMVAKLDFYVDGLMLLRENCIPILVTLTSPSAQVELDWNYYHIDKGFKNGKSAAWYDRSSRVYRTEIPREMEEGVKGARKRTKTLALCLKCVVTVWWTG